jgi:uncharacterized protein YlaN (UPF0358 family)
VNPTNDDPEIRARVLEWQKRNQIRDDDPAMALIELLEIYYQKRGGQSEEPVTVNTSEIISAIKGAIAPGEQAGSLVATIEEDRKAVLAHIEQVASLTKDDHKIVMSEIERLKDNTKELRDIIGKLELNDLGAQMKAHQESIDFATKKMAVIIKDGDDLLARLGKVGSQINPIARSAVIVLMIVSGILGWVVAKLF